MAIETILATVVLPAVMDIIKSAGGAVSKKWFGLSVDDQIKLDSAGVNKLEALAKLDNPYGTPSQWVVDLRASFRYIAAGVLILVGAGIAWFGFNQMANPEIDPTIATSIITAGLETAGTPFFFIFGERMWQGFKGTFK